MRKTLLYLVILGILGFGIYYFLYTDHDNPFKQSEAGFNIKDTASIGKMFIISNGNDGILVERTDSGWMVNKKYKALPSTLNLLLTTLHQQEALYPVPQTAAENAIKALSTDGIKVELYGRDGKKMKVFYVGGASVNNTGTNMLMEGAEKPYVVHVQNFNGFLTPRFPSSLKEWRDRTVFSIAPEEIKSVSVQYAGKPVNSFVISRDNSGKLTVAADENITKGLDSMNTRRAGVYLKYFKNVNAEGYLNGLWDMDTTLKTAPKQSSIDIVGMHGQHQHADIYWMALNRRSKNTTSANEDVPDDYDADRLYAVINNNQDTVMIQTFVFKSIFRKAYEFFQKDAAAPTQQQKYEQPKNVMMHKGS